MKPWSLAIDVMRTSPYGWFSLRLKLDYYIREDIACNLAESGATSISPAPCQLYSGLNSVYPGVSRPMPLHQDVSFT